jgi:Zn-dependent protease
VTSIRRVQGQWLSLPVFSRNGIFFWCAGFVIRLRYTFLVISVFSAASAHRSPTGIFIWVLAALFGVLLHELGHALVARHYGGLPTIELYSLGGLTTWSWPRPPRWTQSFVASLAGPGIGIVFGFASYEWVRHLTGPPTSYWARLLIDDVCWITVGWSIFNLFPILPLDGACALEVVLARRMGADRARHRMRVVSVATGIAVAVLALGNGKTWLGLVCLLFAYNNAQAMRGLPGLRVAG